MAKLHHSLAETWLVCVYEHPCGDSDLLGSQWPEAWVPCIAPILDSGGVGAQQRLGKTCILGHRETCFLGHGETCVLRYKDMHNTKGCF